MTIRVTTKTVIFARPFVVDEINGEQLPGVYTVETEEELLEAASPPVTRRVSTVICGYAIGGMTRLACTNPTALDAALARNATRPWHETQGQQGE